MLRALLSCNKSCCFKLREKILTSDWIKFLKGTALPFLLFNAAVIQGGAL